MLFEATRLAQSVERQPFKLVVEKVNEFHFGTVRVVA